MSYHQCEGTRGIRGVRGCPETAVSQGSDKQYVMQGMAMTESYGYSLCKPALHEGGLNVIEFLVLVLKLPVCVAFTW